MPYIVKCVTDSSPAFLTLIGLLIALLASPWVIERRFPNSKYIAVFLSSGQVYFGHLNSLTRNNLILGYIFYLQSDKKKDRNAGTKWLYDEENQRPQPGVSLVKLGNELHGPEDFMLVNRQHVVFIEHLSSKSDVAMVIEEYRNKNL
jgi:hypothetical protein